MSIKQFDIIYIDLNPTRGREKQTIRPCLVINNQMMIDGTEFVWVVPIINRELRYPTDIELKTKKGLVSGVIDTIQIRALDLNARQHHYKDALQDNLKSKVLKAIQTYLNPNY
ncbi:type II toxin-antitoxin system PemK/MazF family toxin [Staphylococcus pseudintermedius]|uniref:type II toxin-antitoxin system PemK/MazF family toxin n=1 Tax=Staphylococcus pseudintermedius TaxID=283734 RepID=UPI0019F0C6B0|nr:type II toxin-antitoxin system PemK/MazF family toxin [Staphylococcus pseudintermedius]EGQ3212497.1 type II toxin-antitoxin system PemK/MazF family toxin [Staphylococcus pseudintermedius]EGQ3676510.1 type II toxin-antitoxin system PemK/MazF family toxin [Staphylococcus pseudintermedius]EGQ3974288.1 type II toxin-antitoxin system PemK/MazF family toxin [Staphylococcus pseudintermedius]EGQ4072247.1 type II toxin-antitoxin system PemK/MazF family toxin [Staphylococcus pseudintermedius]EGQ42004